MEVAREPDAVVADIGLPQMDGYRVARALRAEPSLNGLCLVAVTGYVALDDIHVSASAGFDHHLSKPPDMHELERILATCTMPSAANQSA